MSPVFHLEEMTYREGEGGFYGRILHPAGADWSDAVIEIDPESCEGFPEAPPPDMLANFTAIVATLADHLAKAIDYARAWRVTTLHWRDAPPDADWSLTQVRIDRSGALWLSLHEFETDEYAQWWVRFTGDAPVEVRKGVSGRGLP
ncbi:MAG: hypothetical protein RJB62_1264 [Pseudomonadota bacterium]|jgi:hypothetical protein